MFIFRSLIPWMDYQQQQTHQQGDQAMNFHSSKQSIFTLILLNVVVAFVRLTIICSLQQNSISVWEIFIFKRIIVIHYHCYPLLLSEFYSENDFHVFFLIQNSYFLFWIFYFFILYFNFMTSCNSNRCGLCC